jgi:zinc D-Ala-D-Ala carboxypeptidase
MKAIVYLNRIKVDIKKDFDKAQDYFKRHGVNITFDFQESDYQLGFNKVLFSVSVGERIFIQPPAGTFLPIDSDYDFTYFVFNQEEFTPPNIPTGRANTYLDKQFMEIGTHTLNPTDLTATEILHETMHALIMKANQKGFNIPDQMDTYWNNFFVEYENSNFGIQWKLLQPYLNSLKGTYKYFKRHEIVGLKPELVRKLDEARGLAGIPFFINSGFRTNTHNAEIGGTVDSSHLKGLAVDLRARNSNEHFLITKALLEVGFTRVSRGYSSHIHCDLDSDKPQNVLF